MYSLEIYNYIVKPNSLHTLIIVITEYMKPNMTKSGIIREITSMAKSVL